MCNNKSKKKPQKSKKSKRRHESDKSSSDTENGNSSGCESGSDGGQGLHRMTKTHKSLIIDKIHLLNNKNALWSNKFNKPIEKLQAWKDLLAYAKSLKILRPFSKTSSKGINEMKRWFVQWKNRCNRRIQASERTGMGHVRPLSDLDQRFYDLRTSVAGASTGKQVGLSILLESWLAIPFYSQTRWLQYCLWCSIKLIETRSLLT